MELGFRIAGAEGALSEFIRKFTRSIKVGGKLFR